MITLKDFENAIEESKTPLSRIVMTQQAAAACFELAKQMQEPYIKALQEIVEPIKFLQDRLKEGEQLNGAMAVTLSKDANYLKEIAKKALQNLPTPPTI